MEIKSFFILSPHAPLMLERHESVGLADLNKKLPFGSRDENRKVPFTPTLSCQGRGR